MRYGVQGTGNTHIVSVSGDASNEVTISGLKSNTTYSIEVAAVNNVGTGVYNSSTAVSTSGEV